MRGNAPRRLTVSNERYTRPVTARRLTKALGGAAASVALLFVSGSSLAQYAKPPAKHKVSPAANVTTADAANAAAGVARQAGDAAEQAADSTIQPPSHDDAGETPLDRAREGVALLERSGKVIGMGTVLAGDGRILSALSPLGRGNNIDARFADGSVTRVKVGHTDRAWDLALLVPQNGRWKKGLKASRADPEKVGSKASAFSVLGGKSVAPARTILKGERTLIGGDDELLKDALEVASRFKSIDLGSPVVDEKGDVIAMIARACAPIPDQPCAQVPYGVPVTAIKAFLRTAPASAVPPAPWLGIQGTADEAGPVKGVRVLGVHPKSPAAAAGLKGGSDRQAADTVVAVDGAPVTTPEALSDAINKHAVGDSVQLLLFGAGKFREVTLTLRPAPDSAKAKAGLAPPRSHRPRRPLPSY
jgi:serine protease Do